MHNFTIGRPGSSHQSLTPPVKTAPGWVLHRCHFRSGGGADDKTKSQLRRSLPPYLTRGKLDAAALSGSEAWAADQPSVHESGREGVLAPQWRRIALYPELGWDQRIIHAPGALLQSPAVALHAMLCYA